MKLFLFDVDGTLLTMWGTHEKVYEETISELYNVPGVNFRLYYTPGRSNEEDIRSSLSALGYKKEFIESRLGDVSATMAKKYARLISPKAVAVLPGVRELLESLRKSRNAVIGIVTGNESRNARKILSAAGVLGDFAFVIGSEHGAREERLKAAVEEASVLVPSGFGRGDIYYFDDSYESIPISRNLGIVSVAVATGEITYDRLASEKPDFLFRNLRDTEAVLKALAGGHAKKSKIA